MRNTSQKLFAAALVALLSSQAAAQTNVNWTGSAGSWNTGSAWFNEALEQSGLLPSADFSEIARIDAGGVVTVNTALADGTDQGASTNPGEVRLGTVSGVGELVIAGTGTLRVQDAADADGGLEVGGAGSGILRVLPGGALTIDGGLASAPAAANLVQLGAPAGAGTASVTVGSAVFGGTTVVHRNASFNSAAGISLQPAGTYRPVLSGALGATLQAAGAVSLAGVLQPDFGGVAPAVGSSWKLLEGTSVSGAFASIDASLAGSLGLGRSFVVTTAAAAGNRKAVQLSLRQMPVLSVNRDTGMAALTNPGTTPISLDGYTISSDLGVLKPTAWNSLQDQGALGGSWRESPPSANRLSELKRTGAATLAAGQTVSLGAVFAPAPLAIGAPTEDLVLQYASPDGDFDGVVTYAGTKVNNILLQVDPGNGQARLRNTSSFTVQIDGYTISSVVGALTPGTWNSLDDQNAAGGDWRQSTGATTRLSELKRASFTTLAPGSQFDLGTIFNTARAKDLQFQYLPFGASQPMDGAVLFSALAAGAPGDFNGDTLVNGADLTIWRSAFTAATAAGDADSDGDTDGFDFLIWQRHAQAAAAPAAGDALAAVPEPASLAIALVAAVCAVVVRAGSTACPLQPIP
ncbi:MAG: hypothetical protein IT424_15490 [Pirellulales bacterium]|nr:hypothetical protein [Pirellulales bacterium]